MAWLIEAYLGVGPLKFGMTADQVSNSIGKSVRSIDRGKGSVMEYRVPKGSPIITYQDGTLEEVTFTRFSTDVFFQNINIFTTAPADVLASIQRLDSDLRECYGAIISYKYGISFTGLHTGEESDKAFTVFAKGRFDSLLSDTRPFNVSEVLNVK